MARELSVETKQTFQIVALMCTVFVVAIHYQSAAPPSPAVEDATWNELAQEFLMGGIARVAVPMFAIAAGLFYFRSDDGSRRTYLKKLRQRCRSVLFPYFIVASVATTSWLVIRSMEGNPVVLSPGEFLATWLLRPPAEQLWFLRDLMVLVVSAPLIRFAIQRGREVFLIGIAVLWLLNMQPFPVVAGWHLVHIETLLFFSIGAALAERTEYLERWKSIRLVSLLGLVLVWSDLIVTRMLMQADFDFWYTDQYDLPTLVVHKASIVVGCPTLMMICGRLRHDRMIRLSGLAFFVYLIHEFPLRAAIERVVDSGIGKPAWFWVTTPAALGLCFGFGILLNRVAPSAIAFLTGGRTPDSAVRLGKSATLEIGSAKS